MVSGRGETDLLSSHLRCKAVSGREMNFLRMPFFVTEVCISYINFNSEKMLQYYLKRVLDIFVYETW